MFTDSEGRDWKVSFDGLLLAEVEGQAGIDLADLSAGGLAKVEIDAKALLKCLVVLCGDQMAERNIAAKEFSKAITGEVLRTSRAAVMEAAASFFPPSEWSDILSRLDRRRTMQSLMQEFQATKGVDLEMSDEFVLGMIQELTGRTRDTDSTHSEGDLSAGGPASTPQMPVSDSPDRLASTPAA